MNRLWASRRVFDLGAMTSLLLVAGCPPERDDEAEADAEECAPEILHCVDDVVRCGGEVNVGSTFFRQCEPGQRPDGTRQARASLCRCDAGGVDCDPCQPTEVDTTCAFNPELPLAEYGEAPAECSALESDPPEQPADVALGCIDDRRQRVEVLCHTDEAEPDRRCVGHFDPDRVYTPVGQLPDTGAAVGATAEGAVYTQLDSERWALCDSGQPDETGYVACRCSDVNPGLSASAPTTYWFDGYGAFPRLAVYFRAPHGKLGPDGEPLPYPRSSYAYISAFNNGRLNALAGKALFEMERQRAQRDRGQQPTFRCRVDRVRVSNWIRRDGTTGIRNYLGLIVSVRGVCN